MFNEQELEELKYLLCWAVSEGYNTNSITKAIAFKLKISEKGLRELDDTANIGERFLEQDNPPTGGTSAQYEDSYNNAFIELKKASARVGEELGKEIRKGMETIKNHYSRI